MKKTVKKILSVMLILAIVLTAAPLAGLAGLDLNVLSNAEEGELATHGQCGDNVYWDFDKDTGELVISGTGEIESNYFHCNGSIKSLLIKNGVTGVGERTFFDCTGLTNIEIPNSVTIIYPSAFSGCRGLTKVKIPDSIKFIGNNAFFDCTELTNIYVSESVTNIGHYAFYNTGYYNKAINWDHDVLYIGNYLIEAKPTLTGDYKIRENTKLIATLAFSDCRGVTSIEIPDSVTIINDFAFGDCRGLTYIEIPDSVTDIGKGAFYYCEKLLHINIPNQVAIINPETFSFCRGLTGIEIPNSVTSIGFSAFYGCTGITSIAVPDSVTYIGENAFYGIGNVDYNGVAEGCPWGADTLVEDDVFIYRDIEKTELIGCKVNLVGKVVIPSEVVSIGDNAFYDCKNLTSITIPGSVTSIGESAFRGCTDLTSITVDEENIVYDSRNSCNAIIEAKTNTLICGCKNTVIPDNITSIGYYSFDGCTGLKEITIPNGVKSIGSFAFSGCTGLTSITIPDSVKNIGTGAFANCTGLNGIVTIPNSITNLGSITFLRCTGLTSIEVPDSVINIDYDAFEGVANVIYNGQAEHAPWGARSVNGYIYDDLIYSDSSKSDLLACPSSIDKTITIPDSVTNIGEYAFYYCSSLKYVYYSGTSEQWKKIEICEGNEDLLSVTVLFGSESVNENISCGFNVETGRLSIKGIGTFDQSDSYPWNAYKNEIRYIEIDNDITAIPTGAFESCPNLEEVYIGKNVTSIGDRAFANCPNLSVVTITSPSVDIAGNAFDGGNSRLMFIVNEDNMGIKTYCIFREVPYIAWSLAKYNETISFSGDFVMYGNLEYNFINKMIEDNRYLKYIHFDKVTFDGVHNNQIIILDDDSEVGIVQNTEYTTLTNANISTSVTDENGETHQLSFNDMFKMAEKGEYEQFNIRLESNEGVWERIVRFIEEFYTAALSSISRLINTIARLIKKK